MSDVLKFEPKKSVNERLKEHLSQSEQELRVAINNEQVTRARVDGLERILGGFLGMPLRYRLRWLVFGMPKAPKPAQEATEPKAEEISDVH